MASAWTLYYTPTSCGAASFLAAQIAKTPGFKSEVVDLAKHVVKSSGADYYKINPKGNVPCLVTNSGLVLNEGVAVLQYINDHGNGQLLPSFGSDERYQVLNALNYVSSEFHPSYAPLFGQLAPEAREAAQKKLNSKLEYLEKHVFADGRQYIAGKKLSIADLYAFIVLGWSPFLKIDLTPYPHVSKYYEHIGSLPEIKAAQAEMQQKSA